MNINLLILAVAAGWLLLIGVVALTIGRVIRNRDRQVPRPAVHVPAPRREAA